MDDVFLFTAVGFAAQLVDGALGMAYGVTATSILLSFGITPAVASASVHAAEVVTIGVSGLSHWWFANVDRRLFTRLVLPGMLGGAAGAYLLVSVPAEIMRPLVSAYLLLMGLVILTKALRPRPPAQEPRRVAVLGLIGGFLDATGGGWGPVVAATLVGARTAPRYAIGSVNAAEFFVTATISATFIATIGLVLWPIIAGLILGGALAAPFAAYVTRSLPDRPLMILVAMIIVLLSLRGLVQTLG